MSFRVTAGVLVVVGIGVGWWAMFTWRYMVEILPHGGMW